MVNDTNENDLEPGRGRRRSSHLTEAMSPVDETASTYDEDEPGVAGRGMGALHHIRSRTRSRTNEVVIRWQPDDPENPYNWSIRKKNFVVVITAFLVVNSTMGSALPSMAIPFIAATFGVTSEQQLVLPISVYLIGYVLGPIIWGPLSEHLGRRLLTIITFILFSLFTMGCALAQSWAALLVLRLCCGVFASSPIAIVAGILADIYETPLTRGRAFAVFMVTTVWGPLLAPILSGFSAPTIGWRWVFWIALIYAGCTLALTFLLPETYGPILLSRRAKRMRKADPVANAHVIAPRDLESTDLSQLLTVVLTRPIRMLISEPIVSTTCTYLALVYAVFYMSFQAFPIIFQDLYGLSPGVTGTTYLPIVGGAILALPVFWYWDSVLAKAKARDAAWIQREEYRRLPLACVGGPCFVIALFWLGFSARADVSFVAPMLAGIPFGLGFLLIFIALLNYLTDAYEVFAASANAAASTCRSLFAVVLPLATTRMFDSLGIAGACSLLGGLAAIMCILPWLFIWKGPVIRSRSRFCIALKERKAEAQRREEEERQRLERLAQSEKQHTDNTHLDTGDST
ncbi:major facilitator superfamily protein [Sarocladium implicatum]|nr:major facilitator superfamily protein [Sarocladium implicatum]